MANKYWYGIDDKNIVYLFAVKYLRDRMVEKGIIKPLASGDSAVRSAKLLASRGESWPIKLR